MTDRHRTSVTSLSWIPSEAMSGLMRLPMDLGISHYDEPPPDHIDDLAALRKADRFRFANQLETWVEVEEEQIVAAGYSGRGHMGSTTLRLGASSMTIAAVSFPDLQPEPEISDGVATFFQTTGGRTGAPIPRRVSRPPFLQIVAPTVWTTLRIRMFPDGSSDFALTGASPFPRHWVYDTRGNLAAKSGLADYDSWARNSFGDQTPWGDIDSPALVAEVESALERGLSATIMRGGERPEIRRLEAGDTLVEQGEPGLELFLVLDGMLTVRVDDRDVAEIGPGAVVGERALLEGGRRTSTLSAVTPVKVAVARPDAIDPSRLGELTASHTREDAV